MVFIVPHADIELEDNKQFISNIPRIMIIFNKLSLQLILKVNKTNAYDKISFWI